MRNTTNKQIRRKTKRRGAEIFKEHARVLHAQLQSAVKNRAWAKFHVFISSCLRESVFVDLYHTFVHTLIYEGYILGI